MCKFEKILPDYLQGELSPDRVRRLEKHLETCEQCVSQLDELGDIHHILSFHRRPLPAAELMREYKKNLQEFFPQETAAVAFLHKIKSWWNLISSIQSLTVRIAKVAALLVIGIFLGRAIFAPAGRAPENELTSKVINYTITPTDLKMMNDYFVQSEMLLLAIENRQADENVDPSDLLFDKKVAQNLLLRSFMVHQKAAQLDDAALIPFLDRMELLFLEISNVDDKEIIEAFKGVKRIIRETNLLQTNKRFQNLVANSLLDNV